MNLNNTFLTLMTLTMDNDNIIKDLVNMMFKHAEVNVTYDDVVNRQDAWYHDWTITEEKEKSFKQEAIKHVQKLKKWPKYIAESNVNFFICNYGLKRSG